MCRAVTACEAGEYVLLPCYCCCCLLLLLLQHILLHVLLLLLLLQGWISPNAKRPIQVCTKRI